MFCLKLCRRRFSIVLLLISLAIFPRTDCRTWKLQTDSQSLTVVNGVESNIDFYLPDYRSLNVSIRIIVQHQSTDEVFIKKCQIEQSASGVCKPTLGPCECVGQSSGSYRYRLRMNFTEQDGGQWQFCIMNHEDTLINISVIPPRALKIYTKTQSMTVEDGETSNIDFFLNDTTAVVSVVTIVVQHQRVGGLTFDPKCRIAHSKTGGCQIVFGPCECIGERSVTYQYRLRMMFTQQDGGMWKFDIVSHEGTIIIITVIGQQSTESLQFTVLTPTIESYTLSTTTLVICIIIVIVIFIIISLVAFRCHSRNQRALIGKTESPSGEQHQCEDSGRMERGHDTGQCEVQSSMTTTSGHVLRSHHMEQTTETSDKHFTKGSIKEEETVDFRKSIERDTDSVTSTATSTTPPTPELPPRLYTSCLTLDLVS